MTDHQQDATATAERCYRPVGKALEDAGLFSTADDTGLYTFAVELLLVPLPAVSLYVRGRDCTLFEAREERLLGSLRRQAVTSRLAGALTVMDSRLVTRVENMVTTSSLEVLGVDLSGTTSNSLWLALLILLSMLPVA